jgi:hypothetical protein
MRPVAAALAAAGCAAAPVSAAGPSSRPPPVRVAVARAGFPAGYAARIGAALAGFVVDGRAFVLAPPGTRHDVTVRAFRSPHCARLGQAVLRSRVVQLDPACIGADPHTLAWVVRHEIGHSYYGARHTCRAARVPPELPDLLHPHDRCEGLEGPGIMNAYLTPATPLEPSAADLYAIHHARRR